MDPSANHRGVALVVGAGDATGSAIGARFAREGYVACLTRRSADKLEPAVERIRAAGGQAFGYGSDARQEEEVVALVDQIEKGRGPIEVMVFNIGANVPSSILEETGRKYMKIWEMAAFSAFLNAREVARRMAARFSSPARRQGLAVQRISQHLPAPSIPCAHWPRAWRASSAHGVFTWPISWSMARSTRSSSAATSPNATHSRRRTAS
jgi:NAD(P)-dependent dehydrogenase (short-subunit alcohol dehydrogenase family)